MLDRPMLVLSLLMLLLVGIAVVAVAGSWSSVAGPTPADGSVAGYAGL